jgi:hypothetical protein
VPQQNRQGLQRGLCIRVILSACALDRCSRLGSDWWPTIPMYYYLVEFPKSDKDGASYDDATKAVKAEGFILSVDSVCGTVNMDLTFSCPDKDTMPKCEELH